MSDPDAKFVACSAIWAIVAIVLLTTLIVKIQAYNVEELKTTQVAMQNGYMITGGGYPAYIKLQPAGKP